MNIVDPILYQCKINPLVTAICAPGANVASINYATLERSIHSAARSALKAGLAPGQTVALFIADTVLHAAVAFALMRLGIATVSLTRLRVPKEIAVDAILTDRPTLNWQPSDPVVPISYDWINSEGGVPDYDRVCPDDESKVCRIILTSGSTGESKGVAFTHQDLAARFAHATYVKGSRFAHCARFFCDLGFANLAGLRLRAFAAQPWRHDLLFGSRSNGHSADPRLARDRRDGDLALWARRVPQVLRGRQRVRDPV